MDTKPLRADGCTCNDHDQPHTPAEHLAHVRRQIACPLTATAMLPSLFRLAERIERRAGEGDRDPTSRAERTLQLQQDDAVLRPASRQQQDSQPDPRRERAEAAARAASALRPLTDPPSTPSADLEIAK